MIPAPGHPAAPSAPEPELRPSETQRAPQGDKVVNNSGGGGGGGGGEGEIGVREKGGKAISREAVERAAELRKKGKGLENPKARRDVGPTTIVATNREDPSEVTEATASTPSSKRRVLPAPDGVGDKGARPAKKLKTAPSPRGHGSGKDGSEEEKEKEKEARKKKKKKKKAAKKGDEFDDLFKDLF